jgi:ABC-type branched-subunit amino acid transport system ATPase component/predicted MFS family arabinose efflux permease
VPRPHLLVSGLPPSSPPGGDRGSEASADFARAVFDVKAHRQQAQTDVVLHEDLLPGTREEAMSLWQGLRRYGTGTFGILMTIVALDNLQSAGLSTLAPNIRSSFHVSNSVITFIGGISGGFLILGVLPMGWLNDRYRRGPLVGFATLFFGLMVFATGAAKAIFLLVLARLGGGISQASTSTVHSSLLADNYPISLRGRLMGASGMVAGAGAAALSPLIMGAIATSAGGPNGWRWAFYALAVPILVMAFVGFRIPEPPRGQFEKLDVLGEVLPDTSPAPPSLEAAFDRVKQVKTVKTCLVAFCALGFTFFTVPTLSNLFLQDHFHMDTIQRGLIGTTTGLGALLPAPFIGRYYDQLYRKDPARALKLVGRLLLPVALVTPIQYFMPNVTLYAVMAVPSGMLTLAAYSLIGPILASVAPYRLRGLVGAVGGLYIFFIGAAGGAVVSALLESALGVRSAVIGLVVPASIVGGLLLIRSARYIRNDLSQIVIELKEELDEHRRQQSDPGSIPLLQLSRVNFSYGHVQVLFDVSFDVRPGEVLALLGTNGAGKSTALRIAAGLEMPAQGAVRLRGGTITYTSPEQRARLGIHMLPGGKGVFGEMTIQENLEMGAFAYRSDRSDMTRRIERSLDIFPDLANRRRQRASTLSGGQQQMLALAIAMLHEPQVLMIDELSLGLAPIVVQDLIRVVESLKQAGVTMIIVEQSLNVAAALADRAVFLEKGQVKFSGQIRELMERDDLARAVFLGGGVPV